MRHTLRPVSMVDAVYEALRERILTGQIDSSEVIVEQKTAELFGVARPTAKAAIDRLVHVGLLHREANKSARVPQLTEDDVRDLYFSRKTFEGAVVAHLAAKGVVPKKAETALRDFNDAAREKSIEGIIDADVSFHRAFVEAMESPRLMRMYGGIIGEAHLCMVLKQSHKLHGTRAIAKEHKAILDAVADGDGELARVKLVDHFSRSEESICAHIREQAAAES